jgi:gluconokinase
LPAMPANLPPARAIIVMGVSGCGKSTLGTMLAGALDCPFLEGDSFHSAQAVEKMRGGCPLTDADRWPWLDRIGHSAADGLHRHRTVVAACSALKRAYRDRLRAAIAEGGSAQVRFVFLDNTREHLLERLGNRPGHYMPASLLDSQLATLERPSADEAALTLITDDPPEELCRAVLRWLAD